LVFDMHGGYAEELRLEATHLSNATHEESLKLLWREFVESASLRLSDRVVCVSKRMINYLHEEKKVPLSKMVYVTNGVDLEFFKPANDCDVQELRARLGIQDKLVFGYVGGFQEYQGVENFIRAAETTDDRGIAFLVIGGRKGLSHERISFIPRVRRNEIPEFYSACDVLVLPRPRYLATEIAAPTKFGEYVAMGKPVLATDVGDASDFVRNSECGIVVPDNSIENLSEGIQEFKERSDGERRTMGRNSRTLAEKEFQSLHTEGLETASRDER
jgi:glycosyltransferase involved in cell wall biosynthesis